MRACALLLVSCLLAGACRTGEHFPEPPPDRPGAPPRPTTPTPTPARPGSEPAVRIGILVDTSEAAIGGTAGFRIVSANGAQLLQVRPGGTAVVRVDGGLIAGEVGGERFGPAESPLRIEPRDTGHVLIAGKPYRGSALLHVDSIGRLSAVNVLDIEEYLLGVVPYEIGRLNRDLIEAVKAQAVAARTYAVGNLGSRRNRGFDFFATVADQVYGGLAGEDSVTSRAVRETRGEILTHAGRPIIAYYSSTCGGRTSTIPESWPWRPPQPYLQSVSDMIPGTDRAYCDTSNRYRWSVSWTRDALVKILELTLGRRLGRTVSIDRVQQLELTGETASGRVEALRILAGGQTHLVRGDSIRWVLQPDASRGLNSSLLFEFEAHREGGEVTGLEVRGGGWGHGIGMCQVGAIGRARAGHSYRDILTAYYTDTRIEQVY